MSQIPVDEELPGFALAFDMNEVRLDLEDALPSLGNIQACRIDRFRYRKGARATFLFEARTDAGTEWITGTLWPGAKAWKNFRNNEGTGYATRTGLLLERFPSDAKLPGVAPIMNGSFGAITEAMRAIHGKSVAVLSVNPVRYRPHIACVLQCIIDGPAGKQTYYLKFYADGLPDMGQAQHLRPLENCSVLQPAASLPDLNAILWPQVRGTSISKAITSEGAGPLVARAATALRAFHQSGQDLKPAPAADVAQKDVEKHASFLHHFMPAHRSHLSAIGNTIPGRFDNGLRMPIHHDMKPEHVLADGNSLTLIDVEGLALGDPAVDIGNMAARIQAMSWANGLDAGICNELANQFVEKSLPVESGRLAAATALGKLKLATYAISHQLPGWAETAASEVESAAHLLHNRSGHTGRSAA